MIKAIIFDCFGVLWVHHGPEYIKNNVADYNLIKGTSAHLSDQTDIGNITQDEYEHQMAELTGLSYEQIHLHMKKGYALNQNLLSYIEDELRPNYKIGMLSNISRGEMNNFFTKQQQHDLFDVTVLSNEVKMIKPDPEIYRYSCQKLGIEPDEAIMIDDIYNNCLGAEAIGMRSIYYEGLAHLRQSLKKYLVNT